MELLLSSPEVAAVDASTTSGTADAAGGATGGGGGGVKGWKLEALGLKEKVAAFGFSPAATRGGGGGGILSSSSQESPIGNLLT